METESDGGFRSNEDGPLYSALRGNDQSVDLVLCRPWNDVLLPQLRRPGAAVSTSKSFLAAVLTTTVLSAASLRTGGHKAAGAENCLFVIERDHKDLRARVGLFDFRFFHPRLLERDSCFMTFRLRTLEEKKMTRRAPIRTHESARLVRGFRRRVGLMRVQTVLFQ